MHWGDPVNTSSKLGEDHATDGDFLITQAVYDAIRDVPSFRALTYTPGETVMSKVSLNYYVVH